MHSSVLADALRRISVLYMICGAWVFVASTNGRLWSAWVRMMDVLAFYRSAEQRRRWNDWILPRFFRPLAIAAGLAVFTLGAVLFLTH